MLYFFLHVCIYLFSCAASSSYWQLKQYCSFCNWYTEPFLYSALHRVIECNVTMKRKIYICISKSDRINFLKFHPIAISCVPLFLLHWMYDVHIKEDVLLASMTKKIYKVFEITHRMWKRYNSCDDHKHRGAKNIPMRLKTEEK